MAKKKEDKITPEGIRMAMEQNKDKIEAALAAAVTNSDGSHPPVHENPPPPKELSKEGYSKNPDENMECGENTECGKNVECGEEVLTTDKIEIYAKDAFIISSQNPDMKIRDHIKALNNRIRNEALNGGFSTNVVFTVVQSDWVNIQHILDWYRARGFQIEGFEQSTPPYGRNAGNIQYNFRISWATPA